MKRILIFFFLFVLISQLTAVTAADLSERIEIDGFSDEFTLDEYTLLDSTGFPLESSQDSRWGEYNDIRQIKVTWDNEFLYVAVDACSWDNNVILFIDIYDDYGIQNMLDLNTWMRSFSFFNQNPDFFLATWDTNNNPQFWKLREGSSIQADELSIDDYSTFDTGNLDRSMEAAIPWSELYYNEQRNMVEFPNIKLVSVITTGSDNLSGPDAAPNNLSGMPDQSGEAVVIDNYVQINVDLDGNGEPDLNIEPTADDRWSFFKKPPFKAIPLKVKNVKFPDGKIIAPTQTSDPVKFELETNRGSEFEVTIYDLEGNFIAEATPVQSETLTWQWDARNKHGKLVPFGVYVLRFKADSGEISHKEAIVVIK